MDYLRSDQYTHLNRDCPVRIDLHPADDLVEITLGEHRIGGDTLRLLVDHPDACRRLTQAVNDAHDRLVGHLRTKASHDPAISRIPASGNTAKGASTAYPAV